MTLPLCIPLSVRAFCISLSPMRRRVADAQTWIIIARPRFNLGDKGRDVVRPSQRFLLLDRGLSPHRACLVRLVGGCGSPYGRGVTPVTAVTLLPHSPESHFYIGNHASLSSLTHQTGAERGLTVCGLNGLLA